MAQIMTVASEQGYSAAMDVSCERCRTEYEFDEARLTDSGVAVKCASCGHIFLVRKPAAAAPAPGPDKPREWKLRKKDQAPITFRELTTLQKWIVEGKVDRSDEISLKGETWKPLGEIPELAAFFQVFENAQKAPAQSEPAQGKVIPFTPPVAAVVPQVAPVASPMAASGGGGVNGAGVAAPAFAPVPPGQGLPSPARPPSVASGLPPAASAAQAPGSFPVVPAKGAPRPPVVREAPPMAPSMLVSSSSSSSSFSKLIPIALVLVGLGAVAFYFGRGLLQRSPPKPATEQAAHPAPQPSGTIAKVIVPVRHPQQAKSPADQKAREAVKTALAQTPTGSNAQKLMKEPPQEAPAPTPTHQELAQAVAKLPAAETAPAAKKPEVAKAEPVKTAPPKTGPAKTQPAKAEPTKATPVATAKSEPLKTVQPAASTPAAKVAPKEPEHDFDWYLSHADRFRQAERTKASLALYQKAIALQPKRAEPVTGLGLAELDLGNIEKAQAAFGKALSLNPSYSVAVMGMAECYRAQGKKPDAIRFYQRFLELVPSGEEAQAARATMARLQQP